jgi:hypothetical protein
VPPRKTTQELIAEEEKKAEQVKARMAELVARQQGEQRKRDAHRKIVVGAAVIAHVRFDPEFRRVLREALKIAVTDPKNRAVIPDLLDEQAFQQAMQAAAKKAANDAKEEAATSAAAKTPPAPRADKPTDGSGKEGGPEKRPVQQGKSGTPA